MTVQRLLGLLVVLLWGLQTVSSTVLAEPVPPAPTAQQASTDPETEARTITLERQVHFMAPDGGDVVADPGIYVVEPQESKLRLRLRGSDHSILLEAGKGAHAVKVEVPIALSIPGTAADEADIHLVQLLSPDGTSLDATGTYSGIRPRGLLDMAKTAAAKAQVAAEAARVEAEKRAKAAARTAQQVALQAQQLALKAKQEAERQAKIAACKVTVATVKAGKAVGGFMSQVLPVAKQRRDGMQQRIAQDPAFREQLRNRMKQAIDGNQSIVPELNRITAYVSNPAHRRQLDALFTPDVLCGGSIAQFDAKLRQVGLVPNFSMVQPRGVDDSHFYMGIQLTLDGAFVGGAQLGLFGVTDFRGNGGFYFFIGPEAGVIVGVGGVLEATFFPKVDATSFAGWGGGVGGTVGAAAVAAADVAFDESFSKFQGFGIGGGAGAGSKMVGSLGASYTHAWKL